MKVDGMNGICSTHWRNEKCIHNLVGEQEEKRPVGRARKFNNKMDIIDIMLEDVNWIHMV
jgi:hypothetical protein